jgi:GYF domain 2
MSWYYAENNERRGPIEDAAFDGLVAAGSVRPETLVWRDGMANWQTLSESDYRRRADALTPDSVPAGQEELGRQPAVEMGVCSESGRILPRSELVEIDGKLVSVEYKNVVLQRIREGVGATGSSIDPEALAEQIIARDYQLSIISCLSRGWIMLKNNFWFCLGAVLLNMLVGLASAIFIVGPFFTLGPLWAGLYWMNLRLHRNEPASLNDAFAGFSRNYWHLVGVGLIFLLTIFACVMPAGFCFMAAIAIASANHPSVPFMVIGGLLYVTGIVVTMYLMVGWIFSFTLIIDKQLEWWPAMKLSRRIVSMHWWRVFGVLMITALCVAGIMFCVAIFFFLISSILASAVHDMNSMAPIVILMAVLFYGTLLGVWIVAIPLQYSTLARAYEDIFGAGERR